MVLSAAAVRVLSFFHLEFKITSPAAKRHIFHFVGLDLVRLLFQARVSWSVLPKTAGEIEAGALEQKKLSAHPLRKHATRWMEVWHKIYKSSKEPIHRSIRGADSDLLEIVQYDSCPFHSLMSREREIQKDTLCYVRWRFQNSWN